MNSHFTKIKKYLVIAFFIVAAVLSLRLMDKVAINYNISDYLDENTETKIALGIIADEFGTTGDIQVMIEDISIEAAKNVKATIQGIENVLTVNFNEYDEGYYRDGNALFAVIVDGNEYSDVARGVVEDIREALDGAYTDKIHYGGTVIEKITLREAIEGEIPFVLAISLCLVVVIMLLTSKSWLEPIVLLLASGVAVLINLGTNAIFGQISYITNAVAAILQLALSIDYSIVLLHSYRKIREYEPDKNKAMASAVKEVLKPVSASALTTIAGLLALLFMSMRIGFDIGIVLMKGIVVSAVVSLTLLPALLLFDAPLNKTQKRELVLSGKCFCQLAFKAGRVVVPIALALIITCGALQFGNTYSFTDSKNVNSLIADTFGRSNTIVVIYPNSEQNHENETELAKMLSTYQTTDGKHVLKNHTAYSNTVRELYNVELAARKLNLPKEDVELLFVMYHLYGNTASVKMTPLEFIEYVAQLIKEDKDVQGYFSEELAKTIRVLLVTREMMEGVHTAEQFHTLATTGVMEGTDLSLFAIRQMYGMYHYPTLTNTKVDLLTMLDFTVAASADPRLSGMIDEQTVANMSQLSQGIKQFVAQMDSPMTQDQFRGYMYQNYGIMIDAATAAQTFGGYYQLQGQQAQQTIPFLNLMSFLAAQNQIPDPAAVATLDAYRTLYAKIHASYTYQEFLPELAGIAAMLTGSVPGIGSNNPAMQQLYILYFYEQNAIPDTAVSGKTFVEFVKSAMATNPIVSAQISESGRAKLSDVGIAYAFLCDTGVYDFNEMTAKMVEMQSNVQSISGTDALSNDKISGVYIKYAMAKEIGLTDPIEAVELLDFVATSMNTQELLKAKMTDENRAKVESAQNDIARATDLFVGENYSRMLLSINLESESEQSALFVSYLLDAVRDTFGEDAHIAGEMVSSYDLKDTFDADNTFIAIFTIISIFIIVMIIFRSLSLPVILVAVIQGAIWIAMSTSLLTGPMFFMSYIVATCILMGATIDYGILMSTHYLHNREHLDKKEALYRAVEAAMPTVFTSGLILTICGLIIGFISSQSAISTVGILLGKGTLVSILMITLVLPSVLYLLDGFILKLSIKKRSK